MAQSHQRPFSRRQLAVIAKIAFIEAMALSLIIPTISSTGEISTSGSCNTSNVFCDQIGFHTTVNGTVAAGVQISTATSKPWTTIPNETMIVAISGGCCVTTITDTISDSFTRQALGEFNGPGPGAVSQEVWTGICRCSAISNQITVSTNETGHSMAFVAGMYRNVAGIGAKNITVTQLSLISSQNIRIIPTQAGSWIFGATFVNPTGTFCDSTVPDTQMIKRGIACDVRVGLHESIGEIQDNATALPAKNLFSYTDSWPLEGGRSSTLVALELISVDKEPSNPNYANLCTISPPNGCLTTQYTINKVDTATSANALNKGLALNVAYCTGITSEPLTTTGNMIFAWANYGGVDLNVTNAKMLVQLYVSTNVPSTVFGVGLCATGGTIIGVGDLSFPISGALSQTNDFAIAVNGLCDNTGGIGCSASSTYYGWIEITAENFVSGSLGFDQVVTTPYSQGWITMQEQK